MLGVKEGAGKHTETLCFSHWMWKSHFIKKKTGVAYGQGGIFLKDEGFLL